MGTCNLQIVAPVRAAPSAERKDKILCDNFTIVRRHLPIAPGVGYKRTIAQIEHSFITPLFSCIGHTKGYLRTLAQIAPKVAYEIVLLDDLSTDALPSRVWV
jgi:hypothetical protein